MPDECHDIILIGAGIVGLSTAMDFSRRFPRLRLLLLEKEARVAAHQSGRNSGVIHSGIYYRPGSMKATTCVQGSREMVEFCRQHAIPHQVSGKVIVATSDEECLRLEELRKRGEANGISGLRMLERNALREIEPHCGGLRALHVPSAGITDYAEVTKKFAELFVGNGGQLQLLSRVTGFVRQGAQVVVETTRGSFGARYVVNCA